jgi:hypothetical protein
MSSCRGFGRFTKRTHIWLRRAGERGSGERTSGVAPSPVNIRLAKNNRPAPFAGRTSRLPSPRKAFSDPSPVEHGGFELRGYVIDCTGKNRCDRRWPVTTKTISPTGRHSLPAGRWWLCGRLPRRRAFRGEDRQTRRESRRRYRPASDRHGEGRTQATRPGWRGR